MKKIIIAILIGVLTLLSINTVQASHYAGAELSYVNIGGASYQITLSFYRDCSGIDAPNTTSINFHCASNTILDITVNLSKIAGTGLEITPTCSQVLSSCNGGSNTAYGIRQYIYQATVTLPPCADWTMYWASGARNPISTLLGTPSWYIPVELNNLSTTNSNPNYNNPMPTIAFLNQLNVLDCGGVDPDGDSLFYSLYAPYASGPSPLSSVTYNIPYDSTNFIPTSTPITLDNATGILSFTPTQVLNTAYGIKVEEWRNVNGVMTKIGTSYRDFTINVINSPFSAPVLSGIDITSQHTYSPNDTIYNINKCFDGNPITFNINGYDQDVYDQYTSGSEEVFSISWNSGISGATFTPFYNGTDSAYAEFSWLPQGSNINGNHSFIATIQDSSCAFNLSNSYTYNINIIDVSVYIGSDTTICSGESLFYQAVSNVDFDYYIWTLDGDPVSSTPTNDFVNLSPSNLTPGAHMLKLETIGGNIGGGCNNIQEISITVLDILNTGTISDTAYCSNSPYTFDAGAGSSYAWQDFSGNTVGTTQYFTPTLTGVYRLIVQNQICFGFDTFTVQIFNSPPDFDLGNDTTIANNASITLSMPAGFTNYMWSNGSTGQTLLIDNSFGWENTIIGSISEGGICDASDTIMVYIGTNGIIDSKKSNIKVYPNPIDDVLNIKLHELYSTAKLELYNASGKLVRTAEFSTKEYTLKGLSTLATGNYFIKIIINNEIIEYSIIKR